MSEQARGDKRYPSGQSLKARCSTWQDFANLYAADVSQGGMFLQTDSVLPIMTELEIELSLPEGHTIQLKARVVHVIDAEHAQREGRAAGVGVQFIDLDQTRKRQIQQLVDFSRWEGGTANRPSLAAALSEMTVSLPPSAVLQALPDESLDSLLSPRRMSQAVTARPGDADVDAQVATATASAARLRRRGDSSEVKPGRSPRPKPPKPADPQKLKLGLTQLAHKNFEQAVKTFDELVQESPTSSEARQWLGVARARMSLKQDDPDGAAQHYQTVLDIDEHNHEARKFVREHSTNKRLNALPFGRYFVKKS
jgi:uncharacterized protein (TIGR02266 family)